MIPLSWSELDCWEQDREAWRRRYILGISDPANPSMKRGTLLHGLIQGTVKGDASPTKEKEINKNIVEESNMLLGGGWTWEKPVEVEIGGIMTKGYWDGRRDNVTLEIKTGHSLWTEQKVNNHGQLWFYAAQAEELGLKIDNFWLLSASTNSGKVIIYETTIGYAEKLAIQNRIRKAYEWMKCQKLLSKRLSSKDRLE